MSWLNSLIIEQVGIKFDPHKLKKYVDIVFILIEKIAIKYSRFLSLYINFYNEMTIKEINLANITKDDKILHLGCGSIPATSILLARETNAKVTGIDINNKSINEAKLTISKLNLGNKPEIIHSNALNYSMNLFDVIVISQGINPNIDVLNHISKNMKSKARILYRTSSSNDGTLAEKEKFLEDIFKIKEIVHHKKNGLLISILLNKK